MTTTIPSGAAAPIGRRRFLYVAAGAFAAAGAGAAAWPFIAQMNPDAGIDAAGDVLGVDLASLQPAQRLVVRWHSYPIFLVRWTDAMLTAMQDAKLRARLADPDSEKIQQPAYAKNWHRSIDPSVAVLVGVCTRCGCVPDYLETDAPPVIAGGYICPCCASRYDPAGRAYVGLTAYNLPVPPYAVEANARVTIGKRSPRASFSLETVERI
jgi:ubiquinol-cytochrome c reductase iron-sulfur subunit